jgi:hypothetical protein
MPRLTESRALNVKSVRSLILPGVSLQLSEQQEVHVSNYWGEKLEGLKLVML